MRYTKSDKQESRDWLLNVLQPGDTIHCILRHVSRSGMSRRIDFYKITDSRPLYLTGHIAAVLGEPRHKDGGLVVNGCGMDMGFHIIYNLGYALFPEGFKVEGRGRNGDTSGWDTDGGYALKHNWL